MNKCISILIVLTIFFLGCSKKATIENGNTYSLEPIPFKLEENGNWGFIDFKGNIIIEPRFENKPTYFEEGYAIISDDTVYYFINTKGDTIGTYYYSAQLFSEGLALIKDRARELFFIDTAGTIQFKVDTIADNKLNECGSFKNGLALFKTIDGTYGFIDKKGFIVIEPKYSLAEEFSEELAYAELLDEKEENKKAEKFFINMKGDVVIKLDSLVEWVQGFNEGFAAFKDTSGCGYINKKGKIVIAQQKNWQDLTNFINGYASYQSGGDWGVIDSTGAKVLSSIFERPPFFYQGQAIIKENDRFGIIDLNGSKIIECSYHNIAYPLFGDRYFAKDGKYYIMIDPSGKQLSELEFARIDLIPALRYSFVTGYIIVGENLGITLSKLGSDSQENEEFYGKVNDELNILYSN